MHVVEEPPLLFASNCFGVRHDLVARPKSDTSPLQALVASRSVLAVVKLFVCHVIFCMTDDDTLTATHAHKYAYQGKSSLQD